ncbi:MAG: nitrate reductase associated protein [Prochlorothrix sp.]|nr:nitrate reductase associated protein [Prochlorothrix sp.]
MTPFFQFETDFVDALRCIPMVVRLKLDTCGVKLKLSHWHQLSLAERQALVDAPCDTAAAIAAYRDLVHGYVLQHGSVPPKDLPILDPLPWEIKTTVPLQVQDQGQLVGVVVSLEQWQGLSALQRFALLKLSQPGHENRNFLPACQEFGITEA